MGNRNVIAIVYDFDGTLAPGYMQDHSLIPELGKTSTAFWGSVKQDAEAHDADEILIYMRRMLECAQEQRIEIRRELLADHGRQLKLFPGVEEWFGRMDGRAADKGFELQHYIVSSGLEEMIRGCSIADKFKHIFASHFAYENDVAAWPAVAVNYTTKTQYLFRINKGVLNSWDNRQINKWISPKERPVPLNRMIFIGDGETDIPSMKMVRSQGGYSIAVYDPESEKGPDGIHRLLAEDRVHFVAAADYRKDSLLDITVRGVIDRIAEQRAA